VFLYLFLCHHSSSILNKKNHLNIDFKIKKILNLNEFKLKLFEIIHENEQIEIFYISPSSSKLNKQKLPKLRRTESMIILLSEEDLIAPVQQAFKQFILNEIPQNEWVKSVFIPNNDNSESDSDEFIPNISEFKKDIGDLKINVITDDDIDPEYRNRFFRFNKTKINNTLTFINKYPKLNFLQFEIIFFKGGDYKILEILNLYHIYTSFDIFKIVEKEFYNMKSISYHIESISYLLNNEYFYKDISIYTEIERKRLKSDEKAQKLAEMLKKLGVDPENL
jgi:hypothetical protein